VLLDERTAGRLRRVVWRRVALVLVGMAAVGGMVALYLSPVLRVHNVEVVGTSGVSPALVVDLAGLEGNSMFRPGLDDAEARIEALPLVRSATADIRWPQTVRIQVTERTPWGYWHAGRTTYVIDQEGVVLPDIEPREGAPTIEDLSGHLVLEPGELVDPDAVALASMVVRRATSALTLEITGLEYSPQDGLSLATDAGYRVVLGDSQNMDYKLAVWQAVEEELGRDSMIGHVLDLRFHDRPSFQ
jgi:cell division protein FtsQ